MSEYFLKPKYLGWNVTVAIDVSSYAKKILKMLQVLIHSILLTKLTLHIDKLDIDKLKNVQTNLIKLKIR